MHKYLPAGQLGLYNPATSYFAAESNIASGKMAETVRPGKSVHVTLASKHLANHTACLPCPIKSLLLFR